MKTDILSKPRSKYYGIVPVLLLLFLCSTVARASFDADDLAFSVVVIEIASGKKAQRSASGFVVQSDRYNGYVVTNAGAVDGADSIVVTDPRSGGKLVADVLRLERSSDFALLKVNGLNMPPLEFALAEPSSGEVVWSAAKLAGTETVSASKGLLRTGFKLAEEDTGWYQHTASLSTAGGAVLLNECGQIIGLNFIEPASDGSVRALDLTTLKQLLARQNVSARTATSVCVSEVAKAREKAELAAEEARSAQREAENAQQVAKQLELQLNASKQANSSLVEQTRQARQRAEDAMRTAEIARARADNTRRELEEKTLVLREETQALLRGFEEERLKAEQRFQEILKSQQDAAASRERILLGFLAVLVVLMGFILYFMRNRTAPAGNAVSAGGVMDSGNTSHNHRSELAEYVLDGRDDDGIRYLLRISGDQLVNHEDGVIIGRNPKDSPYIINHADVSRKHARIKVKNNRVFIEDLGSTNGTSVNGQSIDDKGPVSVDNGDQIIIGSVVMKLRVMDG